MLGIGSADAAKFIVILPRTPRRWGLPHGCDTIRRVDTLKETSPSAPARSVGARAPLPGGGEEDSVGRHGAPDVAVGEWGFDYRRILARTRPRDMSSTASPAAAAGQAASVAPPPRPRSPMLGRERE